MHLLLGIGNALLADDGIGCIVADQFSHPDWTVYNAGTAPENFTRKVRELRPDMLVLVDAARMGLAPGSIRIIPQDRIIDAGIGTHQIPLDSLLDVISPYCGSIILIGIEPGVVEIGELMTPEVIDAGERLVLMLGDGAFRDLGVF